MYKSSRAATAASLLFALSSPLCAEDSTPDTIIVTATRTPQTANESLASVTVLNRADIERSQANDLRELLRGLAGIDISSNGGYGKTTSVFLRGTNPGHVLVLVDGVKIGSATQGAPTWEFLPLPEIDRIEIVRGPRSSLYGSEAIGGVVQIFTLRGAGDVRADEKAALGSFHTSDVSAGVSGAPGDSWFSAHAGRFATDGINATRPSSFSFEPDRDAFDTLYGSARVGYRLLPGTDVEAFVLHSNGNTQFDSPGFNNETDFRQDVGGARLQSRVTSVWNTLLQLSETRDDQRSFRADATTTPSVFNTTRRMQTWQNTLTLSERQALTLGYDRQVDLVQSSTNFTKTSRENDAVFGVYQTELDRHSVEASLRADNNEQFGHHQTGSVAYGYALTPQRRMYVSYGTGFRAPSFNDLYFPGPFSPGDPNLKPEESRSVELGIKSANAQVQWSADVFRTRIENLIILTGPLFTPTNLDRAVINGLELMGARTIDAWRFGANATVLDPRNDTTDKYLPRRSRYIARLDAERRIEKTTFGAEVVAEGSRYDDAANQNRLGGFTLVNLRIDQAFARDWRWGMRLENLLDKEYQTASGFNTLGRALFASLYYQPGR